MVDERFTKINVNGGSDYTSLTTWEAATQGVSSAIHVGVLSSSDSIEQEFNDFDHRQIYKYMHCDFILVTEAGVMLASYIKGQWEVYAADIREAFQQPIEDPDRYRTVAHELIQQRFGNQDANYDVTEAQLILRGAAQSLAELVARNPRGLDEIEWRDVERMLAEVFRGIGFAVELTAAAKDGGKDLVLQCIVHARQHSYVVEVKHWRSKAKPGAGAVEKFMDVIVREEHDGGLFISTYGYTSTAFEARAQLERHKLRFGNEEKIVSLCRTYVNAGRGVIVPSVLPEVLFDQTL